MERPRLLLGASLLLSAALAAGGCGSGSGAGNGATDPPPTAQDPAAAALGADLVPPAATALEEGLLVASAGFPAELLPPGL